MSTRLVARLPADWETSFISIRATPMFTALYDRLVAWGPGHVIVPYLAESWTASADGIVFRIKEGVTASDGSPVGPATIKASLDAALDPGTGSGLRANTGPGTFTVLADDAARTLTVRTDTPNNELLGALAGVNAIAIPPAALRRGGRLDPTAAGSGPYVLADVTPGASVLLRRREGWSWGPPGSDPARLPDELEFRVIADDAEAEELLLAGELHIARIAEVSARVAADGALRRHDSVSMIAHQVFCNLQREPFASCPNLRRALFSALDRREVLAAELGSSGILTNSVFAPDTDCYVDLAHLITEHSPDEARRLLAEAGYVERNGRLRGADGEPLTVELLGSVAQGSAPEYVRSKLTELGVTVRLQMEQGSAFSERYVEGHYDMAIMDGAGPTPSPTNMARYVSGPLWAEGGGNHIRTRDRELEELARAARAAPLEDRGELWARFQAHYLGCAYSLPTGASVAHFVTRDCDIAPLGDVYEAWTIRARAPSEDRRETALTGARQPPASTAS